MYEPPNFPATTDDAESICRRVHDLWPRTRKTFTERLAVMMIRRIKSATLTQLLDSFERHRVDDLDAREPHLETVIHLSKQARTVDQKKSDGVSWIRDAWKRSPFLRPEMQELLSFEEAGEIKPGDIAAWHFAYIEVHKYRIRYSCVCEKRGNGDDCVCGIWNSKPWSGATEPPSEPEFLGSYDRRRSRYRLANRCLDGLTNLKTPGRDTEAYRRWASLGLLSELRAGGYETEGEIANPF